MPCRILLATLVVSTLAAAGSARADTIVTSTSNFVTDAAQTTSFGLPYTNSDGSAYTTNNVTLADGNVLNVNGDAVAASGTGFAPFTNGYAGDLLITNGASETITFATPLTALGFYVAPDVGISIPGFLSNAELTVTLSNGQTTNVSMSNFAAGDAQFVGFFGSGDVTSMTVSVDGTNGFGGTIGDFAFGGFESVPEPASWSGLAGGVLALGMVRRRGAKR